MFTLLRWWLSNLSWEEKYAGFYFSFDSPAGLVYSGLCYTRVEKVCIFKGAFVHVHIVLAEIILIPRNIGVKKFSIKYHNVSTGCYLFLNGFDDRCDVSGQPMILGNPKPHLAASNMGSIFRTAAGQWCVFVAEASRSLHRPPTCYAFRKGRWERWKDVLGEGVTHDWWTRRKLSYRLTQADGSVQLRRISWTGSPDKLLKNNFMDLEDALFRLYVARALCWENNIVLLASCARKRKGFTILFNEHKEIHQKIWCKFNQVVFSNYYHFYRTQTWSAVYN